MACYFLFLYQDLISNQKQNFRQNLLIDPPLTVFRLLANLLTLKCKVLIQDSHHLKIKSLFLVQLLFCSPPLQQFLSHLRFGHLKVYHYFKDFKFFFANHHFHSFFIKVNILIHLFASQLKAMLLFIKNSYHQRLSIILKFITKHFYSLEVQ